MLRQERKPIGEVVFFGFFGPPSNASGVHRTIRIARRLALSEEPVLWVTNDYSQSFMFRGRFLDQDSEKENLQTLPVRSITLGDLNTGKSLGLRKRFPKTALSIEGLMLRYLVPDKYFLWGLKALATALSATRDSNVSRVISTGNPWSSHVFAALFSLLRNVPLTLDYRDGWSVDQFSPTTAIKDSPRRVVAFEALALRRASNVVFASKGLREAYAQVFPRKAATSGFHVIENEPNIDWSSGNFTRRKTAKSLKLFYFGALTSRTPLDVLNFMDKQNLEQKLLVDFTGTLGWSRREEQSLNSTLSAYKFVRHLGFTQPECLPKIVCKYDALLFLGYGTSKVVGSKIYDYLASGAPILAVLGREDGAREVLSKMPGVIIAIGSSKRSLNLALREISSLARDRSYSRSKVAAQRLDILKDRRRGGPEW
jgi:hypothetical protein